MTGRKDCACPRARHQHGTRLAYQQDGCRCFPCRLAHSRTKALRKQGHTSCGTERWPSPVGIRRRLRALYAIGWTWAAMADELGVSPQAVRALVIGGRERSYGHTLDKICVFYDRAWNLRPEGYGANRARAAAARNGWLPPLAWDDDTIDEMDNVEIIGEYTNAQARHANESADQVDEIAVEQAMSGRRVTLTKAETSHAVARLAAMHLSDQEIGERLGKTLDAVLKIRVRNGIAAGVDCSRKAA